MTEITERLKNEENINIQIVFSTDDICAECPNMKGVNQCVENDKVCTFDGKVREYFGIEEKIYKYREIIKFIDSRMTNQIMDDICGPCNWYPVSRCKIICVKNT
jgi:hypothetical protein